jgi:hypothetical protein
MRATRREFDVSRTSVSEVPTGSCGSWPSSDDRGSTEGPRVVAANIKIVRDFLLEHDEGEAEAELGITPPAGRTRRSRRSDALTRITQLNRRGKPQTRT